MQKAKAHIFIYLAVALTAIVIGFLSYRFLLAPKQLQLINVLPKLNALPTFQATNHHGKAFNQNDFIGKWSIVFFGFTTCPDICPTTMMDLNQVAQKTDSELLKQTQFVFVSVDPERDTVEKLANYVPAFNPDFIGLHLDTTDLSILAKNLGVSYMKSPSHDGNPDNYMVDHSARWFIVDPLGRRYGLINPSDAYGKDLVSMVVSDYKIMRQQAKQ